MGIVHSLVYVTRILYMVAFITSVITVVSAPQNSCRARHYAISPARPSVRPTVRPYVTRGGPWTIKNGCWRLCNFCRTV